MVDNTFTPKEVSTFYGLVDTYMKWKTYVRDAGKRSYHHYHPSEWGKAQPYDSIIQTPNGPKKMKDIKVGDVICGVDGDVRKVIQVRPQGCKKIYRVIFSDGDEVECCEDHLWQVNSSQLNFKEPKVLETGYLLNKYIKNKKRCLLSVIMPKPLVIYGTGTDKIISPYLMGVLLGDGCLRCNSVDFTSIDSEIVQTIKKSLIEGYEINSWKNDVQHRIKKYGQSSDVNVYKQELIKYGLKGLKSEERFIPDDYLYATIFDRYEIIKGLMDTDGTIDTRGYARFSTKSEEMAHQFKWLIESIGGVCVIRNKICKRDGREFYSFRCDIRVNNSKDLFSLCRKKERGKKRKNVLKRFIKSIEFVGDKDCQCIAVNKSDGLYLTNNCIVTHNCLRLQQYKHYVSKGYITVEEAGFDSRMLRLFDKGHNMHERWTRYFDEMGILRGVWRCKNKSCKAFDQNGNLNKIEQDYIKQIISKGETRAYGLENKYGVFRPKQCVCGCTDFGYEEAAVDSNELNIHGHCDVLLDASTLTDDKFKGTRYTFNKDFLPQNGKIVVGDMKTISMSAWTNQLERKGPHKYYQIQLTCYAHILDCDYGLLMYENKNNSEIKWYKVERNDKWWDVITWQAKTMQDMASGNKKKLPPPRPTTKTSYDCKGCEFRKICHKSSIWNNKDLDKMRQQFYQCLL